MKAVLAEAFVRVKPSPLPDMTLWLLEENKRLRVRVQQLELGYDELRGMADQLLGNSKELGLALDSIRDAVLHWRNQLAEMDVDNDIINAVLGIIDDYDPRLSVDEDQLS